MKIVALVLIALGIVLMSSGLVVSAYTGTTRLSTQVVSQVTVQDTDGNPVYFAKIFGTYNYSSYSGDVYLAVFSDYSSDTDGIFDLQQVYPNFKWSNVVEWSVTAGGYVTQSGVGTPPAVIIMVSGSSLPTPTPTPSPTPSPSIPEFPTSILVALITIPTIAGAFFYRRRQDKT